MGNGKHLETFSLDADVTPFIGPGAMRVGIAPYCCFQRW
jgi:hypothetical protein